MTVSIGDLYQFTVTSILLGQEVKNVDYKIVDTLPVSALTATELAEAYSVEWQTRIMPYLTNQLQLVSVLAEQIGGALEFGEFATIVNGSKVNEPMPSSVAFAIKLLRSTKVTRNGAKRIAGVIEPNVNGNAVVMTVPEQDSIRGMFAGSMLFIDPTTGVDTFEMSTVIVGRTLNGSGVYELDPSKINPVKQTAFNQIISTQNSRKP